MTVHETRATAYSGLRSARPTLHRNSYLTDAAFARDLERVWWREWVYVCRSEALSTPLSFRLFRIGDQEILILRDEQGALRAFHNTCRHRGSALKTEAEGRLKSRLLVCPYHAWSYSLRGDLVRVPSRACSADFDKGDHPLHRVAVQDWRGFVFVNLAGEADASMEGTFDSDPGLLANWPLERLRVGHTFRKTMACNWKIFWENYNECLHCPGVHPELSALVPIYGRGLMARHDDPHWEAHADDAAPEHAGTLRTGAETWSADGAAHGRAFDGLGDAERAAGQTYVTHLPSLFVVGHVDYVRAVSLRPLGPSLTELTAEWLFSDETMPRSGEEMDNIVSFGRLVLEQDAGVCEINQRGLASRRHERGVLMPEEYDVARFQDWVRARTGEE